MTMARLQGRRSGAATVAGPVWIILLAAGPWPAALAQAPPGAPTDPAYFDTVYAQATAQRNAADEQRAKVRAAAQRHIDALVKANGGMTQVRRTYGASLADLNARLPNPAGQSRPAGAAPGPRLEPGMRVDVIMKNGADSYTGTLVGIEGSTVLV